MPDKVSELVDKIMGQITDATTPGKVSRSEAVDVYGQLVDELEAVLEGMQDDE